MRNVEDQTAIPIIIVLAVKDNLIVFNLDNLDNSFDIQTVQMYHTLSRESYNHLQLGSRGIYIYIYIYVLSYHFIPLLYATNKMMNDVKLHPLTANSLTTNSYKYAHGSLGQK